jgi:hypothetical protein
VEEEREPTPLVLLRRDQLLEEADPLALLPTALALPPLELRSLVLSQ